MWKSGVSVRVQPTSRTWRQRLRTLALSIAALTAATAGIVYASYESDCATLQRIAKTVTAGRSMPSDKVLALTHWVHGQGDSHCNRRFFVVPALRATPLQVLEAGGDCADKSRLTWALLRALEIPSTVAMCFDRAGGVPAHTLVEARVEAGGWMVVDPAFDLFFPRPDGRGYSGLRDLRADPDIVPRRVEELWIQLGYTQPADRYYLRARAAYDQTATINWCGTRLGRLLRPAATWWFGEDLPFVPRPAVLEEPKLAVAIALLAVSLSALGLAVTLGRSRRFARTEGSRRPTHTATVPNGRQVTMPFQAVAIPDGCGDAVLPRGELEAVQSTGNAPGRKRHVAP